jgi:probable phosphoglycerate mutase
MEGREPVKVYLARHGQTVWNRRDVVCGRTDIPLTEKGLQQARELAEQVAATPVDLILASPLQRAQQTAQAVAERIHVPIVTEPLLLEQNFGDYEEAGRFDEEYMAYRKDFFRRFPGGGESIAMVTARAYTLIDKLRTQYEDRCVLLVSHGAFCRCFRTYFEDVPNEAFYQWRMGNCELMEYELN